MGSYTLVWQVDGKNQMGSRMAWHPMQSVRGSAGESQRRRKNGEKREETKTEFRGDQQELSQGEHPGLGVVFARFAETNTAWFIGVEIELGVICGRGSQTPREVHERVPCRASREICTGRWCSCCWCIAADDDADV